MLTFLFAFGLLCSAAERRILPDQPGGCHAFSLSVRNPQQLVRSRIKGLISLSKIANGGVCRVCAYCIPSWLA